MTPPTNPTDSPQNSGQARDPSTHAQGAKQEIVDMTPERRAERILIATAFGFNDSLFDDLRAGIISEIREAEQRATAGMQAAAALMAHNLCTVCQSMGQQAEHDGSLDESRGLFDAAENISKLAQNIEALTQADGTNALRQVEAKARLEGERAVVGGMIIEGHESCTDCGRRMVWEFRGEPGNSWMCANCVCQRMKKAEKRIAELEREGGKG